MYYRGNQASKASRSPEINLFENEKVNWAQETKGF